MLSLSHFILKHSFVAGGISPNFCEEPRLREGELLVPGCPAGKGTR